VEEHDLRVAGGVRIVQGHRANHALSQRRRERRARQPLCLEAGDEATREPDGEHPGIQQVSGIVILDPYEPGGDVEPDDQERRSEGETGGESERETSQRNRSSGWS